MRINQFLARSGIASRRKSEELIESGQVRVNGRVVTSLATSVNPESDVVMFGGKKLELPKHKYYMLNKPIGYVTTKSDPHADKTIFEIMPGDTSLITAGRLDKNTSGLLIVTNDGEFVQKIIHPSKKIKKIYLVTTKKNIDSDLIKKMTRGIALDDGPARLTAMEIIQKNVAKVAIEEGRNRILRRMFSAVGNEIIKLERIQIGDIKLNIPVGEYRALTIEEVNHYA